MSIDTCKKTTTWEGDVGFIIPLHRDDVTTLIISLREGKCLNQSESMFVIQFVSPEYTWILGPPLLP